MPRKATGDPWAVFTGQIGSGRTPTHPDDTTGAIAGGSGDLGLFTLGLTIVALVGRGEVRSSEPPYLRVDSMGLRVAALPGVPRARS